jgi:hypothetical protein
MSWQRRTKRAQMGRIDLGCLSRERQERWDVTWWTIIVEALDPIDWNAPLCAK